MISASSRRRVLLAFGGALASPWTALAQPAKVWRIGYLQEGSRSTNNISHSIDGFLRGLRELGYVEGRNLEIAWRFADGKLERLPALAADLITTNIEVLVAGGNNAIRAAKSASSKMPIVMSAFSDPVAAGFVASLSRPGGNVTGVTSLSIEVSAKWIELLRDALPKLTRVATFVDATLPLTPDYLKQCEAAAKAAGVKMVPVYVKPADDIGLAFETAAREHVDALLLQTVTTIGIRAPQINSLALKRRLLTIWGNSVAVEQGGLMSYGTNFSEQFRRTAAYVDKILKGAKPGELPVEQPTTLELVINMKTAKALGLTIPPQLLFRANRVIE